jgi:hypothetical protein
MPERISGPSSTTSDDVAEARSAASAGDAAIAIAFLQHVQVTDGLTPENVAKALRLQRNPHVRHAVLAEIASRWGSAGAQQLLVAEQQLGSSSAPVASSRHAEPSTPPTSASAKTMGAAAASDAHAIGTAPHSALTSNPAPTPSPAPSSVPAQGGEHRSATQRALELCRLGVAHLGAIETGLLPAYRGAVGAMDTAAVKALALQVVGGVARIVDAQAQIVRLVPQLDTGHDAAMASTAATDPFTPDATELATLTAAKAALDAAILDAVPKLSVQVSPQWFGDQLVAGRVAEPPPHVRHVLVQLSYEAGLVVQLLEEADAIEALIRPVNAACGTSEQVSEGARAAAVDRLERWKSRPINFLFLARVLTQRGVWQSMQSVQDAHGHTAAQLERKVFAQSKETGTTADVGDAWDADEAHGALSYSVTDWKVTDEEASRVLDMLAKAEPRARGELVKQLYRMGRLGALCEHLPWSQIKQLWESIEDKEASKLLEPYWEGKGGGKSLGKRLDEQDHWYTNALNRFLDITTFGAKPRIDASYDAREAGLITEGAYWGNVTKAVGRAAFVMAAMTATGGPAGEFAAGASKGLGVTSAGVGGRVAAAGVSGATAGAAGNVAGHFIGDVYDQVLDGKDGFDPLSSYGESLADGAKFGGAIGLGGGAATELLATRSVGLAASRFLPKSGRTIAQEAAAANPRFTRLLEAARSVGQRAGAHVRTTVGEVLGWFEGGAPPGFKLALAGAGGTIPPRIASAPRGTPVWVTVRPLKDLNAPMQMKGGDEGGDLVEIENIEPESGSIFDSYGKESSYQDDAADWNANENASHADDDVEQLGLAEPEKGGKLSNRRVRHVAEGKLDPAMAAEHGMSKLDASRLDIAPNPRHHLLPQENLEFFQSHGFPGRDIDDFAVDMTKLDHEMLHGGNQALARRFWPEREWSTELMKRIRAEETELQRRTGPSAKISRAAILEIMEEMRAEFRIADLPLVNYNAPAGPLSTTEEVP